MLGNEIQINLDTAIAQDGRAYNVKVGNQKVLVTTQNPTAKVKITGKGNQEVSVTLARSSVVSGKLVARDGADVANVEVVLKNNDYVTFKYFEKIQNDNSAFWDKNRKNWLHILTDDYAENYNRTPVYPEIADQFNERMHEIIDDFNENRRGIIEQ
jgi:hypothetical protein